MSPTDARSAKIWPWPTGAGILAILVASLAPPALWICLVGGILLAAATTYNPKRPAFWSDFPWRRGSNVQLTHLETVVCVTGAALVAAPFVVMLVRALLS
jgi:hypothetical protein